MRCLSCQYDLSHLTEHRCPECGRWFDPEDPRTFAAGAGTKGSSRGLVYTWIIASYVITLAALWLLQIPSRGTGVGDQQFSFWGAMCIALLTWPFTALVGCLADAFLLPVFKPLAPLCRAFCSNASDRSLQARCLGCHYALRELTGHRCPECGRAFDPDDSRSFWRPFAWRGSHVIVLICCTFLAAFIYVHFQLESEQVGDDTFRVNGFWERMPRAAAYAILPWLWLNPAVLMLYLLFAAWRNRSR